MAEQTLTANGDSNEFKVDGPVEISISGTWDSGTATVKRKRNGEFKAVAGEAYTEDTDRILDFVGPSVIKVTMSGIATAADLDLQIRSRRHPGA